MPIKVRTHAQQKAGLTRAINSGKSERVIKEINRAVEEWNQTYWPDDWADWQRAHDDIFWSQSRLNGN
jgi:hypothetical protein